VHGQEDERGKEEACHSEERPQAVCQARAALDITAWRVWLVRIGAGFSFYADPDPYRPLK
jgi:hypothetical protein